MDDYLKGIPADPDQLALVSKQLEPLVRYVQSEKYQTFLKNLASQLRPFMRFVQSEEYQTLLRAWANQLQQFNPGVAAEALDRMRNCRLGTDTTSRAAEPPR
jgi:hypothetical protein